MFGSNIDIGCGIIFKTSTAKSVSPLRTVLSLAAFHPLEAGYFVMTNLALIVDQIKNEITVDATGKGKASIRAVARLMDIDHAGLLGNIKSGERSPSKLAQMLIESGFDSGEQSLWIETGIPDLAIAVIAKYYAYKAGRYCKKQAELVDTAFTGIGVRTWMQQQVGWKNTKHEPENSTPTKSLSPAMISEIGAAIFKPTGLDNILVAGYIANAIGNAIPEYKEVAEYMKQSLPQKIAEEKLIRPGKLADMYEAKTGIKLSAQKINKLLEDKGLQIKNAGGNPSWLPTEEGKRYSELVLDTAKGHNKTVQSLQWYPSMLDVI
jgi:hypothetical protein